LENQRNIAHSVGKLKINLLQFQFNSIYSKKNHNTKNNKDPGSELVEDHNNKKLTMKKRERKRKKRKNMGN